MIITIARECGCNGDDIGRFLAEKYNIPCYTKKELEKIAKKEHIYEKYPFFFNELIIIDACILQIFSKLLIYVFDIFKFLFHIKTLAISGILFIHPKIKTLRG